MATMQSVPFDRALTDHNLPNDVCITTTRSMPAITLHNPDQVKPAITIDFDRLVSNIENSIMTDQKQVILGITPRELMSRANPSIFKSDTNLTMPCDLTNPREMYSALSMKTKSTEDLAVKLKQELANSLQNPGIFPKLSRTASMHEIRRSQNNLDRLSNKPFRSSTNIISSDKKVNVLMLSSRERTSIEDLRKIPEETKETLRSLNLPNISYNNVSQADLYTEDHHGRQTGFPTLLNGENVKVDVQKKKLLGVKEELSASDSKLDKWFSEMPNEVFDKAQRALMEESIKDRLKLYQDKRNRKYHLPNQSVNVYIGSKMRKIPNTYLELRVDSFGKHLQQDSEDKMNKYKLQQKSILKLKMRDLDEFDKVDKGHETSRPTLQHRTLTTLSLNKTKPLPPPKQKSMVISIPTDKGLKTININERVDLESGQKARHLNNYKDYTERLGFTKSSFDDRDETQYVRANSPVTLFPEYAAHPQISEECDKIATPKILNLSLKNEIPQIPKPRQPMHIEKTMNELDFDNPTDDECHGLDSLNENLNLENTNNDIVDGEMIEKHEPIFTKIPTALSSRTSESTSSSISRKSALKKFNTLEVFAESGKDVDAKMLRRNYHSSKLRGDPDIRDAVPAAVKLDLKQYPHIVQNPVVHENETQRNEVQKQDVVFRFEPGEVFISKNKPNQLQTNTRSSERARIIYGKVKTGKDDKKDFKSRKSLKDIQSGRSRSTKLDGYRSELGRFESRALDGSATSYSARNDDGTFNNVFANPSRNAPLNDRNKSELDKEDSSPMLTGTPSGSINHKGKSVRDMATETDVLGSRNNSITVEQENKPGSSLDVEKKDMRSYSGLSDFIVDNNDGESLDSNSEDETDRQNGALTKHSV